jgi:hypothetical protein
MAEIVEKNVAVDGAVVNEGERSSSVFSGPRDAGGSLGLGQRCSTGRKREVDTDLGGEAGVAKLDNCILSHGVSFLRGIWRPDHRQDTPPSSHHQLSSIAPR